MEYDLFDCLKLLGALGLFLYGMKIMSEGLQKVAGDRLRSILTVMTTNRFTGVLTGVLVTGVIQSSSATTVMVVSFVNAGLLSLTQAISLIMGANIGTTVTAWLIALLGFKVDMALFSLPLLGLGIPLIFSSKSKRKSLGEFIYGFGLLFMGLEFLKQSVPDLSQNPEMLSFIQDYTSFGFASVLLFVLLGTIITIIVQSSSATMAITLIMCAKGWVPFELAAALVLGENIGTTITANLAALTANTQARRAALSHLIFNLLGVFWILVLFYPFTAGITWIIETFFPHNSSEVSLSFQLSAFHTAFNLCNVLLLIWFVKTIEKIVCKLIKSKSEDDEFRLQYISGGLLSTAELSIYEARMETISYAKRVQKMFGIVQELLIAPNENTFNKELARVKKYELICDNMELEIANYLNLVQEGELSSESKMQICAMLKEVSEIESVGDSCFNISRTIERKRDSQIEFTSEQYERIHILMDLVSKSISIMIQYISIEEHSSMKLNQLNNIENEINNYRDALRDKNIIDINDKVYTYQLGVYYMDIVCECEKLNDYIINIVESEK